MMFHIIYKNESAGTLLLRDAFVERGGIMDDERRKELEKQIFGSDSDSSSGNASPPHDSPPQPSVPLEKDEEDRDDDGGVGGGTENEAVGDGPGVTVDEDEEWGTHTHRTQAKSCPARRGPTFRAGGGLGRLAAAARC